MGNIQPWGVWSELIEIDVFAPFDFLFRKQEARKQRLREFLWIGVTPPAPAATA